MPSRKLEKLFEKHVSHDKNRKYRSFVLSFILLMMGKDEKVVKDKSIF